jgi:hypothetical protein
MEASLFWPIFVATQQRKKRPTSNRTKRNPRMFCFGDPIGERHTSAQHKTNTTRDQQYLAISEMPIKMNNSSNPLTRKIEQKKGKRIKTTDNRAKPPFPPGKRKCLYFWREGENGSFDCV